MDWKIPRLESTCHINSLVLQTQVRAHTQRHVGEWGAGVPSSGLNGLLTLDHSDLGFKYTCPRTKSKVTCGLACEHLEKAQ